MHDLGRQSHKNFSQVTPSAGGFADGAANRKEFKYQSLAKTYTSIPLAFETLGQLNKKDILMNTALQCIVICYSKSIHPMSVCHIRMVFKNGDSYSCHSYCFYAYFL